MILIYVVGKEPKTSEERVGRQLKIKPCWTQRFHITVFSLVFFNNNMEDEALV